MIELRKQIERDHYNKAVRRIIESKKIDWRYGAERNPLIWRSQFYLAENKIKEIIDEKIKLNRTVRFLDYGCGTGIFSILPAKLGAKVYGIDISEESIKFAKELAKHHGVEEKISFCIMDCEKMNFPNDFFDIVFNCGTLSCLNKEKAFSEIARVLKEDGVFISLDTLGHNPFLNLKRKINFIRGKRTEQTYRNVLKMKDIEMAKKYFEKREIHFFYLLTPFLFFFQRIPGFKYILSFFETIDKILLKISFLRKYAFRVVFIFSQPKKLIKLLNSDKIFKDDKEDL
jgi:ubiquinone/menaquinone biosynthesis C-methylase UbiE